MQLTLSVQEQLLLEEVLEERCIALEREIAHTDHRDFRQTLRKNQELIECMLNRLRVETAAAS